jgi:hypothetical protein
VPGSTARAATATSRRAYPHVAPGAHATERFLEQAARLIHISANAISDIAIRISDIAIRISTIANADIAKSLGIDELLLK